MKRYRLVPQKPRKPTPAEARRLASAKDADLEPKATIQIALEPVSIY